ncbi:hypothetical protein HPP92_022027 [Vanilla planifolia]|uniref:Uncharacterized protein n=1 Tax=Vanilla planifolia TaxID=51239 RepID=A0A835PSL0_VANPL|nr:hypothetical protein HPP92_022027 [Vanilla planifolia]
MLMNELLKLDGVIADGDLKLQRRLQIIYFAFSNVSAVFASCPDYLGEERVQKYVETLDLLKVKNARPQGDNGQSPVAQPEHKQQQKQQPLRSTPTPSVIVTTKWETFDSLFSPSASATTSATTTTASSAAPTPRFDWELF